MLLVAISVLPCLVMLFYQYPLLLLSLFPLVELFEVFYPFYPFVVSGYWLVPMDFVYFFMAIHLGVCTLRQPRKVVAALKENIYLTIFLAVVALSVVLYAPIYSPQRAIGEARKYYGMFLFPLVAWISIKKPEDLRRFVLLLIFVASWVAVAALLQGLHRAIGASGALIVALTAFAMAAYYFNGAVLIHPKMDGVLLLLLSVVAIGLGHRSVWITVGFGLFLIVWLYFSRPLLIAKTLIVGVMGLGAIGAGFLYFPEAGSTLARGFAGIVDPFSDRTASWRIERWQRQLEDLRGKKFLFGEGVGGYYGGQSGGFGFSPHNAFVQMILKLGLVGLVIYSLLALRFLLSALAIRKRLPPGQARALVDMGILSFGAAHGYLLGYGFQPIIWVFFAVGTTAARLIRESPPSQTPIPQPLQDVEPSQGWFPQATNRRPFLPPTA